eukprot:6910151-Prymnesium_polylepis.1
MRADPAGAVSRVLVDRHNLKKKGKTDKSTTFCVLSYRQFSGSADPVPDGNPEAEHEAEPSCIEHRPFRSPATTVCRKSESSAVHRIEHTKDESRAQLLPQRRPIDIELFAFNLDRQSASHSAQLAIHRSMHASRRSE